MSRESKIVVDRLIRDLQERPTDFTCNACRLEDKKTSLVYWVAHGPLYARVYEPYELRFGLIQGWRFMSALNKWKAADALSRSNKVLTN